METETQRNVPGLNTQQVQQMQANRVTRAIQTGLNLLEADINVPIKLHGGLTDLEWLLRSILTGQFSIKQSTPSQEIKPLDETGDL